MSSSIKILFIVMFCMAISGYAQTSGDKIETIALYSSELEAIRRVITPTKTTDIFKELNQAWAKISSRGQELLLAEFPIVTVDSNGKWSYRASNIQTLESGIYIPNTREIENVKAFLKTPLYQTVRQHILATTSSGKSKSETYNNTLKLAKEQLNKAEFEWIQSMVGDEIKALDSESRKALLQDKHYGRGFQEAVAAADVIKAQRLNELSTLIAGGTTRHIKLSEIAFALSEIGREAAVSGSTQLNTMGNRKVLTLSGSGTSIFVTPKTENSDLPAEFTPQNLVELLQRDMIKVYIASGPTSNIIAEVKKTLPPSN